MRIATIAENLLAAWRPVKLTETKWMLLNISSLMVLCDGTTELVRVCGQISNSACDA